MKIPIAMKIYTDVTVVCNLMQHY